MHATSVRFIRGILISAAVLVLPACTITVGSSHATSTPGRPAAPTAAPTAPQVGRDQLDLTLTGTVNARITTYNGTPQCTFNYNELTRKYAYNVSFPINLDNQNGRFMVLLTDADQTGGQYPISKENIHVDGSDNSKLHWGEWYGTDGSGTVTINSDHSGSIDGAIKAAAHSKFNGDGSLLQLKGTWNCAHFDGTAAPAAS